MVEQFTQFGTTTLPIQPGKTSTFGVTPGVLNSVRPLIARRRGGDRARAARAALRADGRRQRVGRGQRPRAQRERLCRRARRSTDAFKFDVARRHVPAARRARARAARRRARLRSSTRELYRARRTRSASGSASAASATASSACMEAKGDMVGIDLDDTVYIPAARGARAVQPRGPARDRRAVRRKARRSTRSSTASSGSCVARHGGEDFTVVDAAADARRARVDHRRADARRRGARRHLAARGRRRHLHDHDDRGARAHAGDRAAARDRRAPRRRSRSSSSARRCCCPRSAAPAASRSGSAIVVLTRWRCRRCRRGSRRSTSCSRSVMAVTIGLVAGVLPARAAARLEPLDALRTE